MATAIDCDMYRHFREHPSRQDEFSMRGFVYIDDSARYGSSHNDDNTLDTCDEETCLGL